MVRKGEMRLASCESMEKTLKIVGPDSINRGPEGCQRAAHGASRGIEGHPEVISAPEGRQRPPNDVCRPSGAVNINAACRLTAYAVGYSLTPLRGSRSPHTLGQRLSPIGPGQEVCRTRVFQAARGMTQTPPKHRRGKSTERSRNVYENKSKWQISPLPWGEGVRLRRSHQPQRDG